MAAIAHWGLIVVFPFSFINTAGFTSIKSIILDYLVVIWLYLTAYGGYYRRNDLKWFRFPLSILIVYFLIRIYDYSLNETHKTVSGYSLTDYLVIGVYALDVVAMITLVFVATTYGALEKPDWFDKISGSDEPKLTYKRVHYSALTRLFQLLYFGG